MPEKVDGRRGRWRRERRERNDAVWSVFKTSEQRDKEWLCLAEFL